MGDRERERGGGEGKRESERVRGGTERGQWLADRWKDKKNP